MSPEIFALTRAAFLYACERMSVHVEFWDREPECPAQGWCCGPGSAWLFKAGDDERIALIGNNGVTHDIPGEIYLHALHELEHLVFIGSERELDIPEQLMMPWAVGVLRTHGLGAETYLRSDYTANTTLILQIERGGQRHHQVRNWKRPERSAWYLRSARQCLAAGVIDHHGLPTWQRPKWELIDLDAISSYR